MITVLGEIENITFEEKSDPLDGSEAVMWLHTTDSPPVEVELNGDTPEMLSWAAEAVEKYV